MIKRIHHIGLSVADLDGSLRFYRDLLGMEVKWLLPFAGERFDRIMRLEGASDQLALLEKDGLRIELFEFEHPMPAPLAPDRPVSDHGISHFGIEVADMDAEYERFREAGVEFHNAPPERFQPNKAV